MPRARQVGGLTGIQIGGITLGVLLLIGTIIGVVLYVIRSNSQTIQNTTESPQTAADNPEQCSKNIDCAPGFICSRAGECFPGCEKSSDCPTGEECTQSQCVIPDTGQQSSSLKDTQWEDAEWRVGGTYDNINDDATGYVKKFRGIVGDDVEMKFKLKDSAIDLCAPAGANVTAFGEVKVKNDNTVGVEWKYLNNDSHSTDFEPYNCCWHRGENANWDIKYLGDARNNPVYDSGLQSVFTPAEAGKMLKKTIITTRKCPVVPWEPCPSGYTPFGKTDNQFCCNGELNSTKSSCNGTVCAQRTNNRQGADWCSTVKEWTPDTCPPGLHSYGEPNNQFCCSALDSEGGCIVGEYSCANKTKNTQEKEWCETNPEHRPTLVKIQGNKWCYDTPTGVACDGTSEQATPFHIRQYPSANAAGTVVPFAMKSPRTNKWCIDNGDGGVVCESDTVGINNVFVRHYAGTYPWDPRVAIKGNYTQKWCSGQDKMTCNRGAIGEHERYTLTTDTGPRRGGEFTGKVVVDSSIN